MCVCVETDISRESVNEEMLRAILRVYFYEHPTANYIQGYSTLAAVCLQAFGMLKEYDAAIASMVYAVFKAMMERFWAQNFVKDFANVTSLSTLTMSIIHQHDRPLYEAVNTHLAGSPLGFLILPNYLLWLRSEACGTRIPNVERVSRLLSLWTVFLCFPDPNRAVAVMIAAMLMEERQRAFKLATSRSESLIQMFLGSTVWDYKRLINRMIELY